MFDAEKVTELIAESLREHQPTTGMKVASGETCNCGYWTGNERPGVTRPVGFQGLQWHQAQVIATLSSLRDAEPRGEYMEGIEEGYKIGKAEGADPDLHSAWNQGKVAGIILMTASPGTYNPAHVENPFPVPEGRSPKVGTSGRWKDAADLAPEGTPHE